jgi:hypothetical protein
MRPGDVTAIGQRQVAANRRNALRSTGPRTAAGKTAASQNAVRHGLRALTPVVRGVEREGDWRAHRTGLVRALAPVGYLEQCLADRVASLLWRLARVTHYESETLAALHRNAPDVVRQRREERPDRFTSRVPTSRTDAEREVERWHRLRAVLEAVVDLAEDAQVPGAWVAGIGLFIADILDRDTDLSIILPDGRTVPIDELAIDPTMLPVTALWAVVDAVAGEDGRDAVLNVALDEVERRDSQAKHARDTLAAEIDVLRRERILPDAHELDKIARYEAALERSMLRTLHELQRLQVARQGGISAPLALDVDIAVS